MKLTLSFTALLLLLMASWSSAEEAPATNAHDVVKTATDELLGLIEVNKEAYRADTQRFYDDLDAVLDPVVDYKRIARRVMGKFYRQASPEQREGFLVAFKQSLQNVYATGLLEYDNEEVVVLPDTGKSKRPDKSRVDFEVRTKGGNAIPISYSMYLNKEQKWMMENVIVNGINIGLTYRNQFARLMKVNKKDIDRVIEDWTSSVNEDEGATAKSDKPAAKPAENTAEEPVKVAAKKPQEEG